MPDTPAQQSPTVAVGPDTRLMITLVGSSAPGSVPAINVIALGPHVTHAEAAQACATAAAALLQQPHQTIPVDPAVVAAMSSAIPAATGPVCGADHPDDPACPPCTLDPGHEGNHQHTPGPEGGHLRAWPQDAPAEPQPT